LAQIERRAHRPLAGEFRKLDLHPWHLRVLDLLVRGALGDGAFDDHTIALNGHQLAGGCLIKGHALRFDRFLHLPFGPGAEGFLGQGNADVGKSVLHLVHELAARQRVAGQIYPRGDLAIAVEPGRS
jgi:hypothetical protein